MAEQELLPCAHCGSHAHVRETKAHGALPIWWVECVICEIGTKYHSSTRDAAATWNARATASDYRRGVEDAERVMLAHFTKYDDHYPHCITKCIPEELAKLQSEVVYDVELNQERLETAVRLALDELRTRCGVDSVAWFQSEYREAVARVKDADEQTVFALRKGTPTLTGNTLPAPPVPVTRGQ